MIYCDDDNDGFGEFMLTDADEDVVNGNPSGSLVVSYHETLADAQNGVNALVSPYANVDPFSTDGLCTSGTDLCYGLL